VGCSITDLGKYRIRHECLQAGLAKAGSSLTDFKGFKRLTLMGIVRACLKADESVPPPF